MKLFVWNETDRATESYHDEGGIVVIAPSLERAREMIAEKATANCGALKTDPDLMRDCNGEEYIAVHPNAGCC